MSSIPFGKIARWSRVWATKVGREHLADEICDEATTQFAIAITNQPERTLKLKYVVANAGRKVLRRYKGHVQAPATRSDPLQQDDRYFDRASLRARIAGGVRLSSTPPSHARIAKIVCRDVPSIAQRAAVAAVVYDKHDVPVRQCAGDFRLSVADVIEAVMLHRLNPGAFRVRMFHARAHLAALAPMVLMMVLAVLLVALSPSGTTTAMDAHLIVVNRTSQEQLAVKGSSPALLAVKGSSPALLAVKGSRANEEPADKMLG
jgi:hypothetical protein